MPLYFFCIVLILSDALALQIAGVGVIPVSTVVWWVKLRDECRVVIMKEGGLVEVIMNGMDDDTSILLYFSIVT